MCKRPFAGRCVPFTAAIRATGRVITRATVAGALLSLQHAPGGSAAARHHHRGAGRCGRWPERDALRIHRRGAESRLSPSLVATADRLSTPFFPASAHAWPEGAWGYLHTRGKAHVATDACPSFGISPSRKRAPPARLTAPAFVLCAAQQADDRPMEGGSVRSRPHDQNPLRLRTLLLVASCLFGQRVFRSCRGISSLDRI